MYASACTQLCGEARSECWLCPHKALTGVDAGGTAQCRVLPREMGIACVLAADQNQTIQESLTRGSPLYAQHLRSYRNLSQGACNGMTEICTVSFWGKQPHQDTGVSNIFTPVPVIMYLWRKLHVCQATLHVVDGHRTPLWPTMASVSMTTCNCLPQRDFLWSCDFLRPMELQQMRQCSSLKSTCELGFTLSLGCFWKPATM